ncbi:hypothetical protein [Acidovorax kalamii]|uniref:hypothetical protein n=1 Tax=Acidovorax kalamii TaxID=2004485 RepID=UPI001055457E|nr:hypothetical protein [Acidovorax kalamii]
MTMGWRSRFGWTAGLAVLCCSNAFSDWRAPREALDQRVTEGSVNVYFTRYGRDAFDAYKVSLLQAQLAAAALFFEQELGLQSPLKMPRYQGQIRRIDVHVLQLARGNGSAGDAAIQYRYRKFGEQEGRALTLTIGAHWEPPNLTPAHELFHAYQYGYTFFKNSWFLEGLARSLENAMEGVSGAETALPKNVSEWQLLVRESYGAHLMWSRLMRLCEPACKPVLKPFAKPCGAPLVKATLEALGEVQATVTKVRGLNPADWPEDEQRNVANVPYMAQGLRSAIARACAAPRSEELQEFERLLVQATEAPALEKPR